MQLRPNILQFKWRETNTRQYFDAGFVSPCHLAWKWTSLGTKAYLNIELVLWKLYIENVKDLAGARAAYETFSLYMYMYMYTCMYTCIYMHVAIHGYI